MITDLLSSVHEQNQPEQCTLSGFDGYKFTEAGKAYTLVSATQAGRVAKFKVYQGSGQQLTPDRIGQELCFNLKSYAAQNGNIYISGFWNDRAAPQGQVAPYQPPQSGSQRLSTPNNPPAPQQANPPQGIQSTVDRLRAVEIASRLVAAGKHETIELYALADFIVDYIQSGKHPMGPAGANSPQQVDVNRRDPDFPNDPRQD